MNDSHIAAYFAAHHMNLLYGMVAMCVAYKLAWIGRQVATIGGWESRALRACAVVTGTVIVVKAGLRFEPGGDVAQWWDIFRELSWCGFLFFAIFLLRKKIGNW